MNVSTSEFLNEFDAYFERFRREHPDTLAYPERSHEQNVEKLKQAMFDAYMLGYVKGSQNK